MTKNKNGQKRATRHAGLPSKDHNGWRIRWIDINGKRRSKNFSSYNEAVSELARIKGDIQAIKDGRAPVPTDIPTLKQFSKKYWVPNRVMKKKRPADDLSIMKKHLYPLFGDLPLNYITTEKVEELKAVLSTSLASNTIRNVLACLSALLHYAQDMGFQFILPKIKKPPVEKPEFNYLQDHGQIKAFLTTAKEKGYGVFALFATAVYSGMRAGELFGLRWSDVNFNKGFITVQRSFNKTTKSGKVRHIPILDILLPILKKWKLQNKNALLFPNEAGNMHTPSPRIIKITFPEVLKEAGLPKMRFHDLRHTFASHWVMKSGDMFKLQKILGHADQQMVQRYAHLAPEAFDSIRGIFGTEEPEKATVAKLEKAKS